jgi:hypothetical protein
MFIDNVETVETPDIVSSSALIWLDSVDRLYGLWRQSLYYSSKFGFVLLGSVSNGEINIIERPLTAGPDKDQSASQMVESRPDVVDSISSNQGDIFVEGRNASDFVSAITRMRIILKDDGIGVFPVESMQPPFEITEVLVGPI